MATQDDVRALALALPGAEESETYFSFAVTVRGKAKGFAWAWRERVDPRKPRVPNKDVLAVRVAGLEAKEILLLADPRVFFTEPHYDGYAAVLVRLKKIGRAALRRVLVDAWRTQAPAALRERFDAEQSGAEGHDHKAAPRKGPATESRRKPRATGARKA